MEVESSSGACLLLTERRTNEGYTVGIYTDISDRKRSGDELQASEQRYRRLVQVSPDAIFVDRDGVIVFANETAARMIGVSDPSELLGTDTLELAASDDRITLASRRRKLREREQTPFGRYRYLRRDGSVGNCESAISSIIWEGEAAILIVIRDIEDRIQAERQQALFGAVLHHAADSIEIVNDDFTLSYVNPAFEEMSGYSSEEVVGKRSMDIFKADEGSAGVYDLVEETLRSGRPWSGMLQSRRKDGSEYNLEASVSPVFNENGIIENFVAIKRDITQSLETKRVLTEIKESYRKLLALTPDAVYVHVDARIVLANKAAVEVFGAGSEEDLIGTSIYDLMHSDVVPVAEDFQRRTGDTLRMEQKRRRLDGEEFWASVSITPLNWNGERGALVILTDITEQRRSQESLISAMESAEIANKSKSEFLANMSHELRTPLNAIIGFSEIMRNEMFGEIGNEHYTEYARDIHESGMHLLYVINDILDLSKFEAGKLSVSLSEVELANSIEASVRLVRQSAADADVTIDTRLVGTLPKIQADERMLKQMLMNLLSNAIKFTPRGSRIRISARKADGDFVEIAVVDAGVGISAVDLPRVLEPFVQADHPVESGETGTGLGLPLTESLAKLHGGSFRLWSRVGLGTRAVLRLPVLPPVKEAGPSGSPD